jgi:hypothetical protein
LPVLKKGTFLGVTPRAAIAFLDRERAKAAQFHARSLLHGFHDVFEHPVDNTFHVAVIEMSVLVSNLLDELRLDHDS